MINEDLVDLIRSCDNKMAMENASCFLAADQVSAPSWLVPDCNPALLDSAVRSMDFRPVRDSFYDSIDHWSSARFQRSFRLTASLLYFFHLFYDLFKKINVDKMVFSEFVYLCVSYMLWW